MRVVENPETFRKNIQDKLNNIVKDSVISSNLEIGISGVYLVIDLCGNK